MGGDSSKRGTVFIYILMLSVHVVIKFQGGGNMSGGISRGLYKTLVWIFFCSKFFVVAVTFVLQ